MSILKEHRKRYTTSLTNSPSRFITIRAPFHRTSMIYYQRIYLCSNTIIATGGSVIFGAEAMAHLADIGTIVYLRASYETVASRVTELKGRGVAMKPEQTLRDIYDERKALYEKFADRIIDVDAQSIESTAQHLAAITRAGISHAP